MGYILGIATYAVGMLLIGGYYLAWKWGKKSEEQPIDEAYKSIIEEI